MMGSYNNPARLAFVGLVIFSLTACASVRKDGEIRSRMDPDRVEVQMEEEDFKKAAQSPLYDFNLKRDEIPPILLDLEAVYEPPLNCFATAEEVERLTAVLGPDPGDKESTKNRKFTLKPADALGSAISSTIPFNEIVRFLSGAEGYEKKAATAFFRGHLRRSYLKGWWQDSDCPTVPTPKLKPVR